MASRNSSKLLPFSLALLVVGGVCCPGLFAQGPIPDAPRPTAEALSPMVEASPAIAARPVVATGPRAEDAHRFWDTRNCALLAATAALSAADFAVTRANLQNGGQELNPMVRVFGRSSAGLAVNFAGETAGVVGLSYLFHKTGHHRLERMVSLVSIGASSGAVGYGLANR